MRSRFSAFVHKEIDYLWNTLHPAHEDRRQPEAETKRQLRASVQRYNYVRLHLIEERGDEVLFLAEIFEKGQERSFAERSKFAQVDGAWKYLSGVGREWRGADVASLRWSSVDETS
jgi:SEC-C motif domain protein